MSEGILQYVMGCSYKGETLVHLLKTLKGDLKLTDSVFETVISAENYPDYNELTSDVKKEGAIHSSFIQFIIELGNLHGHLAKSATKRSELGNMVADHCAERGEGNIPDFDFIVDNFDISFERQTTGERSYVLNESEMKTFCKKNVALKIEPKLLTFKNGVVLPKLVFKIPIVERDTHYNISSTLLAGATGHKTFLGKAEDPNFLRILYSIAFYKCFKGMWHKYIEKIHKAFDSRYVSAPELEVGSFRSATHGALVPETIAPATELENPPFHKSLRAYPEADSRDPSNPRKFNVSWQEPLPRTQISGDDLVKRNKYESHVQKSSDRGLPPKGSHSDSSLDLLEFVQPRAREQIRPHRNYAAKKKKRSQYMRSSLGNGLLTDSEDEDGFLSAIDVPSPLSTKTQKMRAALFADDHPLQTKGSEIIDENPPPKYIAETSSPDVTSEDISLSLSGMPRGQTGGKIFAPRDTGAKHPNVFDTIVAMKAIPRNIAKDFAVDWARVLIKEDTKARKTKKKDENNETPQSAYDLSLIHI